LGKIFCSIVSKSLRIKTRCMTMTIHFSKVALRDGKYYFKKGAFDSDKLVTAKVLFFAESGELECDFNLKDGVFNGVQKLYKDAYYQLSSEETYKEGIADGISRFYKNGRLCSETTYENGNLTSEKHMDE